MVTEQGWHEYTVPTASSLYSDPVETPFSAESWCKVRASWSLASCLAPWDLWGVLVGNTVLTCTEASSVALSVCYCHSVRSLRPRHMLQSAASRSCGMGRVVAGQRWEAGGWDLPVHSLTWELLKRLLRLRSLLFCSEQTPPHQSINAAEEARLSSHGSVDQKQCLCACSVLQSLGGSEESRAPLRMLCPLGCAAECGSFSQAFFW